MQENGRLWVRLISRRNLRGYMDLRNETNRSLAEKTRGEAGRAIIGHLRSGQRTSCSPRTARAIEEALGVLPGSLFEVDVAARTRRKEVA